MKNKKRFSWIISLVFCVMLIGIVSAVCCEKLDGGPWCQSAETEAECDSDYGSAPTSCSQTDYCRLGTCINTDLGTCTPNSPQRLCADGDGTWSAESKDDIAVCQEGCCGNGVAFVSLIECKSLATKYGIETDFREDIRDEEVCYAMTSTQEEGACVWEEGLETECDRLTNEACLNAHADAIFHEGKLCTAHGVSDCAKTDETECYANKVYFLDSCDNRANVYDETRYDDNNDYWTYLQEPDCVVDGADETCGNCNFRAGTNCGEWDSDAEGMPDNRPASGDFVCRDISCSYDGEPYKHGETWCAESEGTYWHLPGDVSSIRDDEIQDYGDGSWSVTKPGLEDEMAYNLPGSRYYKLLCWDGEVLPYPCKDYRNEVCKEIDLFAGDDERFLYAQCKLNNYLGCLEIINKNSCESPLVDCKWITGSRFDNEILEVDEREENQGSCVPLYAPGFDFWSGESGAHLWCSMGTTPERVLYETHWATPRDESEAPLGHREVFSDVSTKDAAERCLENCYAIPDYGSDLSIEQIMSIYGGGNAPGPIIDYYLSLRRGHYCSRVLDPDEMVLGLVTGNSVGCATDRGVTPLFYTNSQWLDFVRKRARSLGDCGLKDNFQRVGGEPGSELITAVFQKLTQQQEVGEDEETATETIWIGEERITDYRG